MWYFISLLTDRLLPSLLSFHHAWLFYSPSMPDLRYLFTYRLTVSMKDESSLAIDFEEQPSVFISIYCQRFCINVLWSKCKVYSNSIRCFLVMFNSVILSHLDTNIVPTYNHLFLIPT